MFLILFVFARIVMLFSLLSEAPDAFSLGLFFISGGIIDLLVWRFVTTRLRQRISSPALALTADTLANLAYAIICIMDLRVFTAFRRPLDLALVREAVSAMPLPTMLSLMSIPDILFLGLALLTPAMPLLARYMNLPALRIREFHFSHVAKFAVLVACLLLPLFAGRWAPQIAAPILRVPGLLALSQLHGPSGLGAEPAAGGQRFEAHGIAMPEVYHKGSTGNAGKTNILVIVLESTGARYVFDETLTKPGAGKPMPFLHSIAAKSLYLSRHYATANSSPRALFSLFTGLYPEPAVDFFSLKRGLKIRGWNTYLAAATSFLVTPCTTEWYFPMGLFKNNGFSEVIGRDQLTFKENRTEPSDARNEEQTGDFFAARLAKAAEPFVATYVSFAPHYPYHDYGQRWRITTGTTRLDRYVDNLRLLDAQLQKFFTVLEKKGSLRNTVVVIVGDHSEAFRQHKGNYIHSLHSYEENLAVPALFYYPPAIAPGRIDIPTSHVDIGPTLLDLLKVEHSPRDFQGTSLLRPVHREFIYAYGNEETVTVYGKDLSKTQRLKTGICRVFDLKSDPGEQQQKNCEALSKALAAAVAYRTHQLGWLEQLQRRAER